MSETSAIVLFDEKCKLCSTLAAFAAKRAPRQISFIPWQNATQHLDEANRGILAAALHETEQPTELGVLSDGRLLHGQDAWQFLLQSYPDLKGLNWMAAKLNLSEKTAGLLRRSGQALRHLCHRC